MAQITDTAIRQIISGAYDLHVHIGPEIIPRKYTTNSLKRNQRGKIAGFALKNHFYPTAPLVAGSKAGGPRAIGSIVLNRFVGGMNADAVYAASLVTDGTFIVWFPTVHAEQFLNESRYEIAPEWVGDKNISLRLAGDITPVGISDVSGNLLPETIGVLHAIRDTGAILATGHISWEETEQVIDRASSLGINSMIITHPIYQRIAMPVDVQRRLIGAGAYIEHCWSMWKIDKIPIRRIAAQIKAVGADGCILSSDTGQWFSPSPSEALFTFAKSLVAEGITGKELELMMIGNPTRLLRV